MILQEARALSSMFTKGNADEVRAAVEIIADVLTNQRWDTAEYRKKALVT